MSWAPLSEVPGGRNSRYRAWGEWGDSRFEIRDSRFGIEEASFEWATRLSGSRLSALEPRISNRRPRFPRETIVSSLGRSAGARHAAAGGTRGVGGAAVGGVASGRSGAA